MSEIEIVDLDDYKKKRIGVFCLPGLENFIKPIVEHLKEDYVVKTCYSRNIAEIESVVAWSDLIWIEWANELAIEMTNKINALQDKKVIVRLHSYEALSNYVPQINWKNIDHLMFVAKHIKSIVIKQFPKLKELVKMSVVHNGVPV